MPDALVQLIGQYGYAILFASVALMNMGIPLPGHMAYVAAAILSGRGTLSLPWVMIVSVIAAVAGAGAGYNLGRRGGRKLVDTYGPRVGLTPPRVATMERFFERHGAKAIFLTRFFIVIRTFGHVFAGVNRVPARLFVLVTSAGAVAWALIFGFAGYFFGDQWPLVEDWLGRIWLVGLVVIVIGAVVHVWWRRRRR